MYTKQTVVTYNIDGIMNDFGLSTGIYDEVPALLQPLINDNKTDGYQHNPLVRDSASTGMWLNKYSHTSGVRIWIDEASAIQWINGINNIMTNKSPTTDFTVVIEDVDPDVLNNLIYNT